MTIPLRSPRESARQSNQSSGGSCVPSPWSLMEKIPSLHSFGHPTFSPDFTSSPVMHASERSWSPVSSLSALTPLSSPERPLSNNVSGGLSCASSLCSPIFGQNSTTARHSKDNRELDSTSRRSLRTASRAVLARSPKHPLPDDHDEKQPSFRTKRTRTSGGPTAVDLYLSDSGAQISRHTVSASPSLRGFSSPRFSFILSALSYKLISTT
ncbi:hypothetical protein DFJ58DRAFT_470279 [Suillus subalutaceus]|uniref:uncharacterized protein n=1 Tax=Suillus subalutaceus TaxID=48586 RepID=UPI001B86AC1A|nr:uncharacterized protein DFJ58DRAFT_470279 [Suillus subalutaceus]KAG1871794.1 hypothetical protein DFJ58DRAFT_470279 [Suillus subalutaceus]